MPAATPFSAPQPQFSRRPRRGVQSIARSRLACSRLACLLAVTCCASGSLRAESWSGATGSEWNVAGNWTPATVPNATDATATFPAAATVNLTTFTATVGTLDATLTSGNLTLGATATTDDIIVLATSSGTPTINVAGGGTIFFYANLEGNQGFEKTGAGKLTWRFNGAEQTYSGNILISGGILGINQNGSLGNDANGITIAGGARLFAEPGPNSGTITLPATRTITLSGAQSQIGSNNPAVNLVIQGPLTESGTGQGLVKTDAGVVTLEGTLSYTGETRIAGGTLALAGSALLPAGQNLRFTGATGSLDVGSTSQTVRTIVMDNIAGNKTITGAGGSLLVDGDANLQLSANNGVTYDFSGLGGFTFNRSTRNFNVQTANTAGVTTLMDVDLAAGGAGGGTNSITAAQILVGGGNSDGNNGNTARLHLGTSNTFRTASFQIGGFNAGGGVDFQPGLTSPSLTLRGTDGTSPTATWTIGETSSGGRTGQGVVDLTGGSLDALVTDLRIGRHVAGANLADTSSLTMPAGTLTAATLAMATKTGGGTPTLTSTVTQSGGTVSIGAITLGDGAGTEAAVLLPTYNLTGGSLAATTIGAGAGANYNTSSTIRTLNLDGGTLRNLTGGDLVIDGLDTTASGRISVTLGGLGGTFEADAGRTITLGSNTALTGSGGITKTGTGSLVVGVDAAYTGATAVNAGTLRVGGALSGTSGVTIAAGALLAGSGTVAATIGGAGTIGPGNSPGILTALQADPSAGLDFDFEFTQANADPTWSNATASVNDVLRLTDSVAPFTASLAAPNNVNVFLGVSSLTQGDTFTGGFFTDASADFLATVQAATFVYYVEGNGGGSAITSNGTSYYSLAQFDPSLSIDVSTVQIGSANFSSGTITNGYSTEFVVVPEPGSLVALGLAGGLIALRLRRRRHAA
jgi:autotransporter-associated beta strand protein